MRQLLFLAQGPKEVGVVDSGRRDGDFAVALGWDFGLQQFEPRQELMTGGRSEKMGACLLSSNQPNSSETFEEARDYCVGSGSGIGEN